MSFNNPNIAKFFKAYQEVIDKYNFPQKRIYNVDATGVSSVLNSPQIFAVTGKKQVGIVAGIERGIHVTVVCCIKPIGNHIPPTFIFAKKKWKPDLLEGAPTASLGFSQESGWITGEIFLKWLKHFQKFSYATKESLILLGLDGHISHKN
ncbi:uncharacterized protein [Diabrotica undecimpunctata]|uniref:uncharacterized protein n=1 Tax=Diabrotica undecimpunctata TaxID=50387 RepID=UPI003B64002C